ncbi:ABC transporter substrate-binding protein/permease [Acetobacter orientalis]|uniref:ABC transporter substrate-binding protein/permease n=1 Tax=Acetobacter orientalis TaxID=146474 RepID=UPI00211B13A7|nr:ABC transporter substrate-binding protein/permease [Acetobacter orientalis]
MAVLVCGLYGGTPAASAQVLRWAADASADVPYTFHDPKDQSRLTGYEYDLMQELGRHLQRPTQFVQNDWDGLIPGLQRGLYDLVICGIEITPEHAQGIDFSDPYYVTAERLVVRKGSAPFESITDLKGHTVGTIKATQAERILADYPDVRVRTYDEESNVFMDLVNGRTDAVLIDGPIAQYYGGTNPALEVVGPPIGRVSYGIAFGKGQNAVLKQQVNAALEQMRTDGSLHRILARWHLWSPEMVAFTKDTTQPDIAPTEWQHYADSVHEASGWQVRFWQYVGFLPLLAKGAVLTLLVSLCAMVLAVALGLALALVRMYGPKWAVSLAALYVEIVRGTPLLIQILFIFYGLPQFGINLGPFLAGVIGLGMNYAAYEAENYRAGLQSVARGQMEAALALNMTHFQALRFVVVPQAFRLVMPVMTNDFISLLKDSSLVSVITLTELTQTYIRLSSTYFDYFGTGLMVGGAYLLIGLPFVRLARMAEKRLAQPHTRRE